MTRPALAGPPTVPVDLAHGAAPPRTAALALAEVQALRFVGALWTDPGMARSLRELLATGRASGEGCERVIDAFVPIEALSPVPPTPAEIAVRFCSIFFGPIDPGSKFSAPAADFVARLNRYATTRWKAERMLTASPVGPNELLWQYMKLARNDADRPTKRTVRRWLSKAAASHPAWAQELAAPPIGLASPTLGLAINREHRMNDELEPT